MVQPSWAQSQNSEIEKLNQIIEQAEQQSRQGKAQQAIETWQQIIAIVRQFKIREIEALALNNIGLNYNSLGQPQEALKYYNQALPIWREIGDRAGVANTLKNIDAVKK